MHGSGKGTDRSLENFSDPERHKDYSDEHDCSAMRSLGSGRGPVPRAAAESCMGRNLRGKGRLKRSAKAARVAVRIWRTQRHGAPERLVLRLQRHSVDPQEVSQFPGPMLGFDPVGNRLARKAGGHRQLDMQRMSAIETAAT